MKRSGIADLPLNGGRVPPWLATRMVTLGTAIAESVLLHYGRPGWPENPVMKEAYKNEAAGVR